MVNTSQQVGGSIGTSLLNTLATSAAAAYLVGRQHTPAALAESQLRSYSTAYWWSAGFFLFGMVICGLLYPSGKPQIYASDESAPVHM